ncbi:microtubule-associated protein futsch-like [Thrips palmi]|uniref:Microtubule-associated protein futsch-like n=1 Tax=Thrips palmi TaxID=161013 RepID=A0A6P8YHE3_THRPL|nr:microtubule-associated protein futsch-like [Thrips palmi]
MQGKSDGVNRVQRSFKDAETLRREELNRRRLLRLEQVRQQSKDVASLVRQKVHSEREKQLSLVQDRVNARTHQWQVRKLKELQGEYNKTVQNVGKSHADAANQPNEEAAQREEAEKISSAAQKRGQEALNRLKEEEKARRRANDERRFQLLNVRAVEGARSAAVVALPCPESTVGIQSIPPKASVCIVAPPPKTSGQKKSNMPEWPKRSWSQQALPLGMIDNQRNNEKGDSFKAEANEMKGGLAYNADSGSRPVSSHGDSFKRLLDERQYFPETTSLSNRLASVRDPATALNSDVQLYDYSSCFPSQYGKTSGIVEKVQSAGEINAKEAADKFSVTSDSKCKLSTAQRDQQRGREALQRVQAQRDYKHFMDSLSLLARQNAALSSCSGAPEKPYIKMNNQESKLKLAVENLLQDAEVNPCNSTQEADSVNTPDGSLIVSHFGDTPGSAPRLNVGLWRAQDTSTEQEDYHKVDSSPSDSIIIAPPSNVLQSFSNAHQENNERETALRSLVQRINDERHSLLSSRQQPLVVKETQDINKERDIRNLEEKVLQQRKQLKVQRSEVKRLGDSIVAPECMNTLLEKDEQNSSPGTSCTHESIIIEHSDPSSNSSSHSLVPESHLKGKGKMSGEDGSFVKDALFYSMDVSMSSVIMDQTESSSSGSKSLSLHGVQVLVKVCGTEEGVSVSGPMSNFGDEKGRVEVIELSSRSGSPAQENVDGPRHIKISSGSMKQVAESTSQKIVEEQPVLKKTKRREIKSVSEKPDMACQINSSSQQIPVKEKKPKPEILSKQVSKDGSKKKTRKKSTRSEAEMDKKSTKDKMKIRTKIAEGSETNVAERTQEKLLEDSDVQEHLTSTSTSYLSPPDKVLSSLTEDIKTLMALAQRNILPQSGTSSNQVQHGGPLVTYINRLLAMSRESIDRLNVSCSEVSTPSSAIFKSSVTDVSPSENTSLAARTEGQFLPSKSMRRDADDRAKFQETIHDESKSKLCFSEPDEWLLHSALSDQGALTDMTRQCHEKISALTKMIEEVRRQAVVNSSTEGDSLLSGDNQSRSTLHLDSTAYMSPPPHVLEWADVAAPALIGNDKDSRMSLDPYSNAVVQLLADVRSHMSSKVTELSEPLTAPLFRTPPHDGSSDIGGHVELNYTRPKPPVAFWRNIERCNAMSPTEPHELSTILELGTTLPESIGSHATAPASPAHGLSPPSTPGTPPDVIAELMRRNLLTSPFAWAKKMDSAPRQSSGSSSPMKNSVDSDLSSGKTGAGQSDISASRETNTVSFQSQNSSSNGSKDWKTNILMSPVDLYSSADEVEGDFRRMGIGWVGAMLRKTKEAGALSTTSSSDGSPMKVDNPNLKEVFSLPDEEPILSSSVTVAIRQGRGHSTPIKHPSDLSSTGSHSHLV